MITEDDLMFVSTNPDSVPQWSVTIGGRAIAEVVQRPISFPTYRVSVSGEEERFFMERKEVLEYLVRIMNP